MGFVKEIRYESGLSGESAKLPWGIPKSAMGGNELIDTPLNAGGGTIGTEGGVGNGGAN